MKREFFPKVKIEGKKLIFNSEAIETMELDTENAKVVILETTNTQKKRQPKEILIIKTNGSLCDDIENIKDVFPPELIRNVIIISDNDEISYGVIDISDTCLDSIKEVFGKEKEEFKLLVCNIETPLGKEFKEQFDITNNYYRFAYMSDKRISVGKDRQIVEKTAEERISIN